MSKRLLFYSAWLSIHLIQAYSTELFDDEAYYWVYSRFPAWGYFDHPPMIALLIKGGYAVFKNELGVRLLTVILSTASVFLIEELLDKKNSTLFYAICGSLALAQIGGMMAVPDTPLMFFVALFFWLYRKFTQHPGIGNTLLMGLCIALMLYTKYHGVLVVLFTGLSNLKLLRQWQTWTALCLAVLLFLPHIYWQHLHDYPSVQFHLFERNSGEYEWKNTFEYLLGQVVIAGPVMGWLLIIAAVRYRPVTPTERALKFSFIGMYLFFLLSTLKGRAEANWTIPGFVGMMVLAHQYLLYHQQWRRWLYYGAGLTLLLVFTARILMMIDMPPAWWLAKDEFHRNRVWVNSISMQANGAPVIFQDSYQKPSKYWFYSGDTAMGLNTPMYRRNNFNFWPIEDSLNGRTIYFAAEHRFVNNYFSLQRIMIDGIKISRLQGRQYSIKFRTVSPQHYLKKYGAALFISIYQKKKLLRNFSTTFTARDITNTYQQHIISVTLDSLPPGKYSAKLSLGSSLTDKPSLNSSEFSVVIE